MTAAGLALGASRTAGYLAVALVSGGVGFVFFTWRPSLRSPGGAGLGDLAVEVFVARATRLALLGCALGVAGVVGILIAGPGGPPSVWLAVEMMSWIAVASFLFTRATPNERMEPDGPFLLACCLALLGLVLAGEPSSAFVGALTLVHVIAAALWVGGIAYLVLALPSVLHGLEERARAWLLLEALSRFSPLAFGAVIAIVLTGTVHAAVVLPTFVDLWQSAFGRLVIVKVLLVLFLVGLGALNRNHVIPSLRTPDTDRRDPRRIAVLARRALAWEALAMVAVLIASAALVAAAPPSRTSDPYPYSHVDTRRSAP